MSRQIKERNHGHHGKYQLISDLNTLPPGTFNKIACLEVFEHLPPQALQNAVDDIKRLLEPNGTIVVSVPIEIGPSSLLKNLARSLYHQQESSLGLTILLKSFFGLPVERKEQWGLYGHTGFDHRTLENVFRLSSLKIRSKSFCPFPLLRGVLNSQVFYQLSSEIL
jgi:2-polyprenyl-3-methyl-5-hydroxy-6-metoxy-1,4-benzoquinol methylase